jgi:hypothetical protein
MVLYSVDSPQKIGLENQVVILGQKTPKAGYFHLIAVKNNTPYSTSTTALVNLDMI